MCLEIRPSEITNLIVLFLPGWPCLLSPLLLIVLGEHACFFPSGSFPVQCDVHTQFQLRGACTLYQTLLVIGYCLVGLQCKWVPKRKKLGPLTQQSDSCLDQSLTCGGLGSCGGVNRRRDPGCSCFTEGWPSIAQDNCLGINGVWSRVRHGVVPCSKSWVGSGFLV